MPVSGIRSLERPRCISWVFTIFGGILLGIGEGTNVIISKQAIQLDSQLLHLYNWSVFL